MEVFLITFIKRRITVIMCICALIGFGIASLGELNYELMPKRQSNVLSIITRYPGNSPSRIEELITKPIEKQIVGVGGVEKILSSSEEGESRVTIFFYESESLKYKSVELKSKIDIVRASFPREVDEPYIVRFNPEDRPIFVIRLVSKTSSLKEIREIAEKRLKSIFERIPGVGEVLVIGGRYREIRIDLKKGKLLSSGLMPSSIMSLISSFNRDMYLGKILDGSSEIEVRLRNRIRNVDDIRSLTLQIGEDKKLIKLTDLATIYDGERDLIDLSREKGEENVSIHIKKNSQANILEVCEKIKSQIALSSFADLNFDISYDQSKYIESALESVTFSGIVGAIACSIIVLIFLNNYIYTIIVSITIPIAILIAFTFLHFLGKSLNIMTLAGLALGVGVLIDSSIVMIEKINSNLLNQVKKPIDSAVSALWKELLASSITNIIVFIPLLFASSDFRANFLDLATSVTICVVIAYFLSLILVPMLADWVIKDAEQNIKFGILKEFLNRFEFKFWNSYLNSKLFQIIHANHKKILYLLIFLGSISSFFIKKEYIDIQGSKEIAASVELPTGTSLPVTSDVVKKLEKILQDIDGVDKITSKVEKWHADLTIKLKADVNNPESIKPKLRTAVEPVTEAFVYFHDSNSIGSNKELDIDLIGDDQKKLKEIAKDISESIKNLPKTDQVIYRFRDGKKEFTLNLDREKIRLSNLSNQIISDFSRTALQGSIPTKIFENDREVDIRIRFEEEDRREVDDIRNSIISSGHSNVSLKDLVKMEKNISDTRINRKNKRRMITITATCKDASLSEYAAEVEAQLEKYEFPTNYFYEFGDSIKKLRRSQIEMIGFILFAVILTYAVLSILFQSLTLSLVIMIMVPINLLITTFFLYVLGQSYNLSTYIGFILLAGLSINNSIMLLENYLSLEKMEMSIYDRISLAKKNRKKAMQMTTLTTIIALLPGIFLTSEGSEFWRPMSFSVVIGMTISYSTAIKIFPDILSRLIRHKK
ncbi:efflux RND transporter permease subunit [Leptospira jelokensis]|uniref:efflux RND transporter permease subunit n=1 Tax=Leptospira jelokensis TaxID=2484931 RepID=UPI001091620F|nr:efflux RND transporter permease subunit [Leptospira jelokensis]TGM06662.1 efflux RND transporter permease subunit [Leptospira jelokensis]